MTTTQLTHDPAATSAAPTGLRAAGAAGVLAVAALVGALFVLPADAGGTAPDDIAARYADGAAGYLRATTLELGALALTCALLAGLAVWAGRRSTVGGAVVAVGGAVLVAGQLAAYAVIATLALDTAGSASADVVVALYNLSSVLFVVGNVGLIAVAGACLVGARRGHLVFAGWSLLAGVGAAGTLALTRDGLLSPHGDWGFLTVLVQMAWMLAGAVVLIRDGRRQDS